jgi:hypothetical protein
LLLVIVFVSMDQLQLCHSQHTEVRSPNGTT